MYRHLSRWVTAHGVAASIVVLLCSASTRLFMASRMDAATLLVFYPDAATYITPAHSLIEKHAFLDQHGAPTFHRTPGYPAFLAGLIAVVGPDLRNVLIAQALILSLGPLLLYWLGRRIVSTEIAFVAALLAAASPWGAVLAGIPISDGLFVFVLMAMMAVLHLTLTRHGPVAVISAAGVGLLTGLAILVRPFSPLVLLTPVALLLCLGYRRAVNWALCVVTLVCAVGPPAAWVTRNHVEANFDGLTDVTSQTAWAYLAARVRADTTGQNRYAISDVATSEETTWGVAPRSAELDRERWARAGKVFRDHPFRTARAFVASAVEHTIHPSPDVLTAARLNFRGDILVLSLIWGALLVLSAVALWDLAHRLLRHQATPNDRFLIVMIVVCSVLTVASGLSFAAGSRLRAPLELVVPLLAAAALFRSAKPDSVETGSQSVRPHGTVSTIMVRTAGRPAGS